MEGELPSNPLSLQGIQFDSIRIVVEIDVLVVLVVVVIAAVGRSRRRRKELGKLLRHGEIHTQTEEIKTWIKLAHRKVA